MVSGSQSREAAKEPFLGADRRAALLGLEQSLQLGSNASGEPWAVGQRHENLGPHTASWAVGVGKGQGDQTQQEKVQQPVVSAKGGEGRREPAENSAFLGA